MLPHGGDQLVGIGGVHHQVAGAGALVDVEDLGPGPATVRRPVDPAILRVGPRVSQRAHVRDVGVGGMEDDGVDGAGALEAEPLPRLPAVHRLVDAGADPRRVAAVPLAGPDPDDVRGRLVDRDRPDGGGGERVHQRLPRRAARGRSPQPAGGGADVDDVGVVGDGVDRADPAAHAGGADAASRERLELRVIDLGDGGGDRRREGGERRTEATESRFHEDVLRVRRWIR